MTDTNRIRELNDEFRTMRVGGQVLLTPGIMHMPDEKRCYVLDKVRTYSEFNDDNDPHGEHNFGSFEVDGKKVHWKIDSYDDTMDFGSPDPADPSVTTRVLTIMLADEY